MAAKAQQSEQHWWEVLTRNALGRETVHRHRAATAEAAVDTMLGATGIDREEVVEVRVAGT